MVCRGVGEGEGEGLLDELMSCWTECAPGQLAAGPELTAVQCMEATLQCLDLLLHHLPSLFPKGELLLHFLVLPLPCMVFLVWLISATEAVRMSLHQ